MPVDMSAHIDTVPGDVLRIIFSALSQRDACSIGCTSRAMAAAHADTKKVVVLKDQDDPVGCAKFLIRHAGSVYRLSSTNRIVNYFAVPGVVRSMGGIRHLKLTWSSVPEDVLRALPDGLESLYVRRVVPAPGGGKKSFATSALDASTKLHHVSLWFSALYDEIVLDHFSTFSTLFIAAPTIAKVKGAPPGPMHSLRVDCNALWFHDADGVLNMSPKTKIRAVDFSIPRDVLAHASMGAVETLSYDCPSRSWVPYLSEMKNLKRIFITLDNPVARLDDFSDMKDLEELVVRARFSFGTSDDNETFAGFGRGVKVSVFVNGQYSPFGSMALMAP